MAVAGRRARRASSTPTALRGGVPGRDGPGRGVPARPVRERVLAGDRGRDALGTTYAEALAGAGLDPGHAARQHRPDAAGNGVALTALLQQLIRSVAGRRSSGSRWSATRWAAWSIRAAARVVADRRRTAPWIDRVSDVVTLGTPHLGSPVASGVGDGQPGPGPGCPRPRPSDGSSTGARWACTTSCTASADDVAAAAARALPAGGRDPHPLGRGTRSAHVLGDALVRVPSAYGRGRCGAELFPGPTCCTSAAPVTSTCSTTREVHDALLDWLA